MFKYFSLISCLIILVSGKELPQIKSKIRDLRVIESQEHNFLEPPSYKNYQQNNNGYNEEGGSAPEPYMFNFDIQDNDNNKQFRKESSDGGAVKGSYGYLDSNGLYRTVDYTADSENGFQAKIRTNEPGMNAYYLDNTNPKTQFPADVILEVAESPRNLQYSSSDQISNNHYSNDNYNYQQQDNKNYQKNSKNFFQQQYNEPSENYAASNNYNFKTQELNRASEHGNSESGINKNLPNNIKWNTNNWNTQDKFERQSFSSSHPIYVDSNSKLVNLNNNNSSLENKLALAISDDSNLKFNVIKNQKFSNKLLEKPKDNQQPKKFLSTNLQLEKPIQQFRTLQQYRPFNEIRQKFINKQPKMFIPFNYN